ncbi:MAG: exosortase K [Clostridiales bacterium]|nr:exosortase K [Clostridiales bacterium]
MWAVKRSDFFFYVLSLMLCAVSYFVLHGNIELALLPHKVALEYLFNYNFNFIENVGYEQVGGLFIVGRNCLGVKLFINLFLLLVLGFLSKCKEVRHKILALIKFYFLAALVALSVTIIRIAASIPFCSWERFQLIHNLISLGAYFMAGLVLYYIVERRVNAI